MAAAIIPIFFLGAAQLPASGSYIWRVYAEKRGPRLIIEKTL